MPDLLRAINLRASHAKARAAGAAVFARARRAVLTVCVALALVFVAAPANSDENGAKGLRIVSLNPSLTAILLALGAAHTLVGVDDYSANLGTRVASLPKVGGLFAPSLEAVVALQPDVVVLVPSVEQRDFRTRLDALGIRVEVFDNIRFEQVIENITRLGAMVDRREAATQRVAEIRRAEARVARVRASTASARVLLVLQRDPIFVAGPGSFIAEMVSALGAQNIAAELGDAYPRVATEWVVDRAPEILIDLSPDNAAAQSYWSRWPSIPAVRDGRVIAVDAELISMPGPHLDRSLAVLGEALYGESIAAQIRGDAPKRDAARP